MTALVIYPLLSAALYYLGSRAMLTQGLWSKYPPKFGRFMDCSACTGFWWGFVLSLTLGNFEGLDFLSLASTNPLTPLVVALCSIVWTPIMAGLMQRSLDSLGVIYDGE